MCKIAFLKAFSRRIPSSCESRANQLHNHDEFIKLLEGPELGMVVLAAPGPDGWPIARTSEPFGRGYRHHVAVKGNNNTVIWLAGAGCRSAFDPKVLAEEFKQRCDLFEDPSIVFKRFIKNLKARIKAQWAAYPGCKGQLKVALKAFEWLNPEYDSLLFLSLDTMQLSDRKGANSIQLPKIKISGPPTFSWDDSSMPEAAYPYYSELQLGERDITDLHRWFCDGLEEPMEENGWMPFWLNLPNSSPDDPPSGQVPDESENGGGPATRRPRT